MSSAHIAAAGATIVLAACGGAAVFALTAGPHAASSPAAGAIIYDCVAYGYDGTAHGALRGDWR